jgi:hypothetical protein
LLLSAFFLKGVSGITRDLLARERDGVRESTEDSEDTNSIHELLMEEIKHKGSISEYLSHQ